MLQIGDQIGPYVLVKKFGQGGFGSFWLAELGGAHNSTLVALNIFPKDAVSLEAMERESGVWKHAGSHPNLLPILEANIYDNQVVIASQFAPDDTLESWLEKHGGKAPSIESVLKIASDLLLVLEHLHTHNIVHRDLKPSNILLSGNTIKLIDFGISRVLKSTDSTSRMLGTPAYMPPEAWEGRVSQRSDIWSVGVILHQLVTGQLPFPAVDTMGLIEAILTHSPAPLPPSIPPSLRRIITVALAKDPSQRYQSASEMLEALRALKSSDYELPSDKTDDIKVAINGCIEEIDLTREEIARDQDVIDRLKLETREILARLSAE
jgi:eukaryotic-like serine/threonine-protein kinase